MYEVGEQVRHGRHGVGTVSSGVLYLVDFNGTLEYVEASELRFASKFYEGQPVIVQGASHATVVSDPIDDSYDKRHYVVLDYTTGRCFLVPESGLEPQ